MTGDDYDRIFASLGHKPGCGCASWIDEKVCEIGRIAGNDAAKIEKLTGNPELERELRELYPGDLLALQLLKYRLDDMRVLARHGVFVDYSGGRDKL